MPCEGRSRWRKGVIAGHVGCVYAHKACDCEARCKTHADVDGCRDETAPGDDCIDNLSTRHDIIARLTRARLLPSALHRGPSLRLVYAHKRRAPRRRCLDAHRFRDGSTAHIQLSLADRSSRSRMRGGFPNEVDRRDLCRVYAHKLRGSQATRPIQRKGSVPRRISATNSPCDVAHEDAPIEHRDDRSASVSSYPPHRQHAPPISAISFMRINR